jgi:DNA-binding CsgD family transcriptional regulator
MIASVAAVSQLLERTGELSQLDELLEGGGRLALVRGEAGIGKTSLVRRFCERQPPDRVLWGACDPLYTPRPLGPFLDVARATGGELELLARAEPKPYELADALMRELERAPARIVVVEDMHWADEATLDVLRIVVRRLNGLPALVVATYRDDEVDRRHPLRRLLGELSVADRAARIPLAPLSLEAVGALAAEHGVDAADLYRRTNGNPFFVTELLAAGTDLPETLRDAVLARAAHLGPQARSVVDAAAVTPPHAELWLLDALVPGAQEVLDECLASGMLSEDGERVGFRHELARLAIEDSLPATKRRELHARALAALAEPPVGEPDAARLAHHAGGAGDVEAVLLYAPAAAARAASVGAHREAVAYYAQALVYADRLEPRRRAELLERQAHSAYITDENPAAVEAALEAAAVHHELGDTPAEASALVRVSGYLWCPGHVAESTEAGRRAVELLEPLGESPEFGLALSNLAFLAREAGDRDAANVWSERALAIAELHDQPEQVAGALAALGESRWLRDPPSGRKTIQRALELARDQGYVEGIAWMAMATGRHMLQSRDYDGLIPLLEQGVAFCSEHGFELFRQYDLAFLARAELDQGLWAQAADHADEVIRLRRSSTMPTIFALVVIGLLRARRGDPDPWSPLAEADELAGMSGELPRLAPVAAALAEAAWLGGRADEIESLTQDAYELAQRLRQPWVIGELAFWRREAAAEGAAEPYALMLAGDWGGAAEQWARIGCPYEAALALAEGDEESLRAALAEFHRLDGRATAAVVSRRLRELGARGLPRGPRPSTRDNPAGLTRREAEVLALVAEGLQNSEIAGRLFLSVKTVDTHVASILRKLGVRSRGEASVAAMSRGLLEPR